MKKILSVLLAIALLAGIMPLAMADENVPEAETPVQAEEQAQEEAVVPFTGRLTLFNCRPLIHGEMAYLKANVENANKSFSIFWDKLVQEEWERIPGAVGDCLSFAVDKTYGDYSYRAVLRAEDGTILTAEITVSVERPAPQEPAQEEPAASEPEGNEPEASQPEVNEPTANEPETTEPQVSEPEVNEPAADEPETTEPQANEPEVIEPAASEPEADEPKADEPEAAAPEASEPEATEPETTEPEAAAPGAAEPEATEPEVTEPEATEPEATEPEATEPEVTEQETTELETIEPEATEPEAAEPEAAVPEAAEPKTTEPEAAEPEATEPEATEPEAVEPEAEEPEVTEPEAAEPEEEEPAAEEPEVVEPEGTEPENAEYETIESETTELEAEEPADGEYVANTVVSNSENEITEDIDLDEETEDYQTIVLKDLGETTICLREDADGLSSIITDLNDNAEIAIISVDGDWVKVIAEDRIGYIFIDDIRSYLEVPTEETEDNNKVEMKVTIFSSRRTIMEEGEPVYLTSKLEGFEECEEILYIWKVDKGDGFEVIEGANEETYTFTASEESLTWDWHLTVLYR